MRHPHQAKKILCSQEFAEGELVTCSDSEAPPIQEVAWQVEEGQSGRGFPTNHEDTL